jgi:hypothetical protein
MALPGHLFQDLGNPRYAWLPLDAVWIFGQAQALVASHQAQVRGRGMDVDKDVHEIGVTL